MRRRNGRSESSRRKPPFIADLDSATAALQATANFLHDRDRHPLGPLRSVAPLAAPILDVLPNPVAEWMYSWGGWIDALPMRRLADVDDEAIARGITEMYPKRRYPAVIVGSTNGAAVHLAAALGIPFIPQTLLIVVRRHVRPDEAKEDLEWGREPAALLSRRNPDMRVYQMHDANQDRLMLRHMGYFRVKRLRLGRTLESFLVRVLEPGGTLISLECDYSWPSTTVTDRHVFQFGGLGGITNDEYLNGGARVSEYLERVGSRYRRWDPPEPSGRLPEAEWGFDPELRSDVEQFAAANGFSLRRLQFDHPEDLSAPVAEFYRHWYRRSGRSDDTLLLESFTHVHPRLALTAGMVPYWSVFNATPSVEALHEYLGQAEGYRRIFGMLFSNSVEGVGIASIDEWRSVLRHAGEEGRFVGVNEERYPRDLASFVRHYSELKRLDAGLDLPDRLTLEEFESFLASEGGRYRVKILSAESSASDVNGKEASKAAAAGPKATPSSSAPETSDRGGSESSDSEAEDGVRR